MKRKNLLVLTIVLLTVGVLAIQYVNEQEKELEPIVGNGVRIEEKRNLGDTYSSINVSNTNIIIKPIDTPSLKIIADSNLLNYITTEIKENTLYISSQRPLQTNDGIFIEIGKKQLERIKFSGKGDLKSEGVISGKEITVNFDGVGNLDLELEANNVKVVTKLVGGKRFIHTLKGKCASFVAFVEGSVTIDAKKLKAKRAKVAIYADNTMGNVIVNPEELLEIDGMNIIQVDEMQEITVVPRAVKTL